MRSVIIVALLISLATVVGCKEKGTAPAENTMGSTGTQSMEQPKEEKEKMDQSAEAPAAEAPAADAAAAEAPAAEAPAAEAPATGDAK